jgi:hypothetical protein
MATAKSTNTALTATDTTAGQRNRKWAVPMAPGPRRETKMTTIVVMVRLHLAGRMLVFHLPTTAFEFLPTAFEFLVTECHEVGPGCNRRGWIIWHLHPTIAAELARVATG